MSLVLFSPPIGDVVIPNLSAKGFTFGAGGAVMGAEGNINRQVNPAGVQPGSTAANIVLATYTLPAGSYDLLGRGLNIMACGSMTVNANVKTLNLVAGATSAVVGSAISGGTTIGSLITTGSVGGGWQVSANLFKSAALNAQLAIHEASQVGSFIGALLAPSALALVENAAIIFAVVGNAATLATDITFNFLDVNAMN